jgi:predicted lactoylglutathione lyase
VNLLIENLDKTKAFWQNIGFSFNEQFSDDKALGLVLNDRMIYSMLITQGMFSIFTNRPMSEGTTTQVLMAIEVNSRKQVDEIVRLAIENGRIRYRQSIGCDRMYYDCSADLDGHQ